MSNEINSKNTELFNGCEFEFTKPGPQEYGVLSRYLEQKHVASFLIGAHASGVGMWDALWAINNFLVTTPYAFGRRAFFEAIQSPDILPAALWLCLRQKQAAVNSPERAAELLNKDNWHAVQIKVLSLFGLESAKNPVQVTDAT